MSALGMLAAFWLGTIAGAVVMAMVRVSARADAGLGLETAACARVVDTAE